MSDILNDNTNLVGVSARINRLKRIVLNRAAKAPSDRRDNRGVEKLNRASWTLAEAKATYTYLCSHDFEVRHNQVRSRVVELFIAATMASRGIRQDDQSFRKSLSNAIRPAVANVLTLARVGLGEAIRQNPNSNQWKVLSTADQDIDLRTRIEMPPLPWDFIP